MTINKESRSADDITKEKMPERKRHHHRTKRVTKRFTVISGIIPMLTVVGPDTSLSSSISSSITTA